MKASSQKGGSSMVEIVWEFVVKEEARGQFELAYGPGGAWSKLFARRPGFRGTTLLRDTKNPRRYLTVDLWETEAQREQVLTERKAEYSNLDAAFADWTESRTEVGVFRMLAEAAVRPRGRAGRTKTGEAGRRSRRTTR
jgi:heme-degrading monooxygenase HmoA